MIEAALGHYRVVEKIGSGGMGEVYRARDERLGRDVAIKVLKHSATQDQDRLRRFEQEARAAAALNHPNIVAIYDIGDHEGSPYIVTEYLVGQTLRRRLLDGAMSIRQVAEYGRQTAQGLVAAHDKRIVHRDLKPENLFLTQDGLVKILDFGIAKLSTPEMESESGSDTDVAFMTTQTKAGAVLGTVAYMSPEQLRGKPVDHRSDIFSLGVILYEMLTGKRAFTGETDVDTITAILKEDPPEVTQIRQTVPAAFDQIVRHCIEKETSKRFQSAGDLAFALSTVGDASTARQAFSVPRERTWLKKGLVWIGAGLLIVAAGVLAGREFVSVSSPVYMRVTFERGTIFSARFAPDGKNIFYSASWNGQPSDVYSTINGSLMARPLGYKSTQLLGVSNTNELALELNANNGAERVLSYTLARAPIVGGAPREVLENVSSADWNSQGQLAVVHHTQGKARLEFPVGNVLYENAGSITNVRFSREGDKIAFLDHPSIDDDRGSLNVIDLSGHSTVLADHWDSVQGLAWAPNGEIWFTATLHGNDRSLWAVNLKSHLRKLLSAPGGLTLQDISPDGTTLVTMDNERLAMDWADRDGKTPHDLSWFSWTIPKDVSSDGQEVFFEDSSEPAGPNYSVGIRTVEGSPPIRLGDGSAGGLSPDGKWALAVLPSSQKVMLYPTRAGESVEINVPGLEHIDSARFLADGQHLVIMGSEPGRARRTFLADLRGNHLRPVTPEGTVAGMSSPDGKFLVTGTRSSGLRLFPVEGGEARDVPGSKPGDIAAQWSGDGRSLYVYQPGEVPLNIYRLEIATGKRQLLQTLMPADRAGVVSIAPVITNPKASGFAYSYDQILSTMYRISGLR